MSQPTLGPSKVHSNYGLRRRISPSRTRKFIAVRVSTAHVSCHDFACALVRDLKKS